MNILITANCHEILINKFKEKGFNVLYKPKILYEELEEIIQNIHGLVLTTRIKVDKNLITKANNLKWIGRLGSGLELIDLEFAKSKNIICISTPEGNSQAVAEHCMALLLNLMNNINKSYNEIKNNLWIRDENRGEEIAGKTIGIIGFGNTGSAFAKCINGFSPKQILVYDKYKNNFLINYIKETSLEDILNNADIISIHLPLTNETKHLINENFINKISKKIYLINSSRGEIINTNELIKSIENNKFKGVLLDVLENEKINQLSIIEKNQLNKLLNMDNVLITPHIAGYSFEAFYKMSLILIDKLENNKLI